MAQGINVALSLLSGFSYGGVTYFRNLIPALAQQDKCNQYHIFVPTGHELLGQVKQDNFIFHEVHFDTKFSFSRHFWEQFVLPFEIKRYNIDILFTAKNANVLFAPCKTIISIRNMEPLCFERYKNAWRLNIFSWLRRINTMISARKADRIIAVSQAVQDRLSELMPQVKTKIDIIYNGNPYVKSGHESPPVEIGSGGEYLLTASKFVAYANQLNLVKSYALLAKRIKNLPPLWMAGGVLDKSYYKQIRRFVTEQHLDSKIKFLGIVPHEHLIDLYGQAQVFIFPSTLEACPHTLIEAMACGAPVAASHTPPMPEIGGNGALYFDPYDVGDMAEKIEALVQNLDLCQALRVKGLARSMCFDWEKTAAALIRVFEDVALGSSGHCPDQVGSRAQ